MFINNSKTMKLITTFLILTLTIPFIIMNELSSFAINNVFKLINWYYPEILKGR